MQQRAPALPHTRIHRYHCFLPDLVGFAASRCTATDARSFIELGERGIRTLETFKTFTRFPGVLLQPLGHLSTDGHKSKPEGLVSARQVVNFFWLLEALFYVRLCECDKPNLQIART